MLILGSSLRFFGGYALGFWTSQFYKKKFPKYQDEFSIGSSLIICICGISSSFFGGAISDFFDESNIKDIKTKKRAHPEVKGLVTVIGGRLFP